MAGERDLTLRVVGDVSGLRRALAQGSSTAERFGSGLTRSVGHATRTAFAIGARAAGVGALAIGAGLVSSAKKAADFEQTLNVFQATAGASAKEMQRVSKAAIALGADTKLPATSAADAAEAMTELAKGGLDVRRSMAAARGTLELSAAAQISNAEAAKLVAQNLNAFSLRGREAGKVADLLAASANATTASIPEMGLALSQAAAVAHQFNIPIEDTVTALGELANRGIKGSDAGTSLKTMLQRLVPSTNKAADEIKRLHVEAFNARGQMLPLSQISERYRTALQKLTPEQRASSLQTIFGSDAIRAANIILGQGSKAFDILKKRMQEHDAAAKLAAARTKGFRGAMQGLQSTVETLQIQIGTKLLHGLTVAGQTLSKFIGRLSNAKNWRARIQVVVDGLEEARRKISEVLFGGTKRASRPFHMAEMIETEGVAEKMRRAFDQINWDAVGRRIGIAISASVTFTSDALENAMGSLLAWVDQNQARIAEVGAVLFLNLAKTLTDPGFWAAHWQLALGVAAATIPIGRLLGIGGKLVEALLRPFAGLGRALGGVVVGAFRSVAVSAAVAADRVGVAAAGALAKAIRSVGGRLGDLVSLILRPLGPLGTAMANVFFRAVGVVAQAADNLGARAGTAVAAAIRGTTSLVTRAVTGLAGAFTGAIRGAWASLPAIVRGLLRVGVVASIIATVSSAVSAAVSLGRSIVNGIRSGLANLATLGVQLARDVISAVQAAAVIAYRQALSIGAALASGVVAGVGNLAGRLASSLTGAISGAFNAAKKKAGIGSPSKLTAKEIGAPLAEGIAVGFLSRKGKIQQALSAGVRDAIRNAKSNLNQLGDELASMIAQAVDAASSRQVSALDNSDDAKRARAINRQIAAEDAAREQARLQAAIDAAETPADRAEAEQELSRFLLEQERDRLEASLEARRAALEQEAEDRKAAASRQLADLTDALNRGLITEKKFNAELLQILGDSGVNYEAVGTALGSAFANAYLAQIKALRDQVEKILGGPQAPGAGLAPDIVDPGAVAIKEWQEHLKALRDRLADAVRKAASASGPGGKARTAAERDAIEELSNAVTEWEKQRPRFALGGIVTKEMLARVGEGNRAEAIIPLSSSRARPALERAGIDLGGSRTTIEHIDVNLPPGSYTDDALSLVGAMSRHLRVTGL